ncbi:hypothetical protein Tco_1182875 [Tanacetum coccineum]
MQLANESCLHPLGFIYNVMLHINFLDFVVDFIVLDTKGNDEDHVTFGRTSLEMDDVLVFKNKQISLVADGFNQTFYNAPDEYNVNHHNGYGGGGGGWGGYGGGGWGGPGGGGGYGGYGGYGGGGYGGPGGGYGYGGGRGGGYGGGGYGGGWRGCRFGCCGGWYHYRGCSHCCSSLTEAIAFNQQEATP